MTYAPTETTIPAILDAAESLFVQRSYASVSMQQIAEKAGMTKGALYHHFANKEALYLAMMLRDLEAKRALSLEATSSGGSVRQQLRSHTHAFLKLSPHKRKLIQLVRRDINILEGKTRKQIVSAYQEALPNHIERILQAAIAEGEIDPDDPRLLAWSYVALVEVAMSDYADTVLGSPDKAVEFVSKLFFSGVGAGVRALADTPNPERSL